MKNLVKEIRTMNLVKRTEEYEVYEDDNSGDFFEIDIDGGEAVAVFEVEEDGECIRRLA